MLAGAAAQAGSFTPSWAEPGLEAMGPAACRPNSADMALHRILTFCREDGVFAVECRQGSLI